MKLREGNVLHLSLSHSVQRWGCAWGVCGGVQGGEGLHGGEHGRGAYMVGASEGDIHGKGMAGGHTC